MKAIFLVALSSSFLPDSVLREKYRLCANRSPSPHPPHPATDGK